MSTQPPEPPPDAAAEERRCPRCSAPYEPLQEYCLECGQRLVPLPSDSYTRTVVWSRESPVWLWIALLALLLVALAAGAIVALAATDDDEPAGASSSEGTIPVGLPTTGPITIQPPTTGESTITIPPFTGTTTTFPTQPTTFTTSTTSTTTTGGSGTIQFWPPNTDGFTVVLKSTPVSEGRGPAESSAQQALNAGLPEVGILDSSNFSTLNRGYYVTFTGVYDTLNEAENALPRARSSGFPTAYVREVAD